MERRSLEPNMVGRTFGMIRRGLGLIYAIEQVLRIYITLVEESSLSMIWNRKPRKNGASQSDLENELF